MYVHDLNCDWLNHPFARNQFKINNADDLRKIRKLGIKALYIDTEKGADVVDAQSAQDVAQKLEQKMRQKAEEKSMREPLVSLKEERDRAERIQNEANRVVIDMMGDARLGKQLEVERVNPLIERMAGSIFRNQDALLGLTRIRQMDRYTFEHSVGVAVLMISFARALGLSQQIIQEIGVGALLHDIGKTLIPNEILNKPGKLSDDEFDVMRTHVTHSRDILARSKGISPIALAVAAEHHERFDGSGYPDKKEKQAISRYGQMAAIVDVYDAITADRVYHKGMEPHVVLRKLLEWSQHHFNPILVQKFIQCVGIYPVGSLVRLQSARLAMVVESGAKNILQPVVRLILDIEKRRYLTSMTIDLSHTQDRIVGSEDPKKWRIKPEVYLRP
jgi:putative nucleotidyltransferase with HDIG domain